MILNSIKFLLLALVISFSSPSWAGLVFDTWTTNENGTGNYTLTIEQNSDQFHFDLDIDPWNAEALALFFDLGDVDITTAVELSSFDPISLYATDSNTDDCGNGCNLNGLNPPLINDGEWELVFRIGDVGFDGISNLSFTTSDFGLELSDFVMVGIRAQQLCEQGELLSEDGDEGCEGSDKSYGSSTVVVPESNIIASFILALILLAWGHSRVK